MLEGVGDARASATRVLRVVITRHLQPAHTSLPSASSASTSTASSTSASDLLRNLRWAAGWIWPERRRGGWLEGWGEGVARDGWPQYWFCPRQPTPPPPTPRPTRPTSGGTHSATTPIPTPHSTPDYSLSLSLSPSLSSSLSLSFSLSLSLSPSILSLSLSLVFLLLRATLRRLRLTLLRAVSRQGSPTTPRRLRMYVYVCLFRVPTRCWM